MLPKSLKLLQVQMVLLLQLDHPWLVEFLQSLELVEQEGNLPMVAEPKESE